MKIELLGTGGYFANERRQTACVLLPEWGLVFDAGSALFRLPQRCSQRELHIFLTHAHLDHIVGLPFLLMPILYQQLDRCTVHATEKTLDAVRTHLFAEPVFPVPVPFTCEEILAPGQFELVSPVDGVSRMKIQWQTLPNHPGGSMAYRVDVSGPSGACSMAYVTDTTMDGSYTEFIREVDFLIHECYFADERAEMAAKTGHSYATEVAQLANDAGVKRMVAVHLDPTLDVEDPIGLPAMRAIFPQTEIGVDGMQIEVMSSRR